MLKKTLIDNVTPVSITSSTDATPIVITATAHGFNTGDRAYIYGHTTNVAANGIYKVTKVTANTFSLQGEFSGSDVAGSGAGAGGATGFCMKAPLALNAEKFDTFVLQIDTSGSATATVKAAISQGRGGLVVTPRYDFPNFGATVSNSNPYTFAGLVDLDTQSGIIAGSTGVSAAGTDIHKTYEMNISVTKFLTAMVTAWTAGAITVTATLAKTGVDI